ncbi:MAG: hypothetical protein A2Z88_09715 [Omnitrophica WOR_2 bacterium GWA2_47_8]|nr:MAG: hypothetical protein A2Z88_09715 [Omnitrophica WOR_2 bacterium GWA2_47_8]
MSWLLLAVTAHFLTALVFIGDKILLVKKIPHPVIYSFYLGIFGILMLVLIPFGVVFPQQITVWLLSLLAGAANVLALYFFYFAMKKFDASQVVPITGAFTPIFTFIAAFIFLGERLSSLDIISFSLLVLGGLLVSLNKGFKLGDSSLAILKFAALAGFIFAVSFVLMKFSYQHLSFINGFFWPRMGGAAMALFFLVFKENRDIIFSTPKTVEKRTMGLVILNQSAGGTAFILLNIAIFFGSVTLINALQGVQYAFLLALVAILSLKFPHILKEEISQDIILQKIIAILFIGAGLSILAAEQFFAL